MHSCSLLHSPCSVLCCKFDANAVQVTIKKCTNLHQYLFRGENLSTDSTYSDPTAITQFDRLDFIFMDCDASLLPWSVSAQQMVLLTKMCYQTNKCLYASGSACQILAYVSSTDGENLNIINGSGRGGALETIQSFVVRGFAVMVELPQVD